MHMFHDQVRLIDWMQLTQVKFVSSLNSIRAEREISIRRNIAFENKHHSGISPETPVVSLETYILLHVVATPIVIHAIAGGR